MCKACELDTLFLQKDEIINLVSAIKRVESHDALNKTNKKIISTVSAFLKKKKEVVNEIPDIDERLGLVNDVKA